MLRAGGEPPTPTSGVTGNTVTTVGKQFPDLGHAHLAPGQPHPQYNSDPPTSGAHIPEPVLLDRNVLNNDQLLEALEVGDVVLMYGTDKPPPGLAALARAQAGPFSPALAAAGQAVVLAKRPKTNGVLALAWTHMLNVSTGTDPALALFIQQWLGRGAPGH